MVENILLITNKILKDSMQWTGCNRGFCGRHSHTTHSITIAIQIVQNTKLHSAATQNTNIEILGLLGNWIYHGRYLDKDNIAT